MYVERAADDMCIYSLGVKKTFFPFLSFFVVVFLHLSNVVSKFKGKFGTFPTRYNLKILKAYIC